MGSVPAQQSVFGMPQAIVQEDSTCPAHYLYCPAQRLTSLAHSNVNSIYLDRETHPALPGLCANAARGLPCGAKASSFMYMPHPLNVVLWLPRQW